MREIKFRMWNNVREIKFRMWNNVANDMSPTATLNKMFHIVGTMGFPEVHEQSIPMQYTGLKDKYGIEIYEGDIIGSGRFKEGVVKFDECGGGGPDEGFRTMGFYVDDNGWDKGLLDIENPEVLGNIYENPELLTSDKH